ncbi:hypothetical protein GCK32_020996, partial [Trichostrongylus colubriformis]
IAREASFVGWVNTDSGPYNTRATANSFGTSR